MEFSKLDQIEFFNDKVVHQSAGGFVFFESSEDHTLYVALLQKPDGNFFIPKGHIQKNEEPDKAAIREVREELQLKINPIIITKIGVSSYTFGWPGDKKIHYKNVHLYVFNVSQKEDIEPSEEDGFISADWLEINDALKKIAFDRDNLLKARQLFYFHKPVEKIDPLESIRSINIGIPTHNGAQTIHSTLKSIINSVRLFPDKTRVKIIICLDYCADKTRKVIDQFISNIYQDNIEFVVLNNDGIKGKSAALNKIFKHMDSDIICFIDDDVDLNKRCLISLAENIILHNELRCVFARWVRHPLTGKSLWRKFWHWVLGVKFDIQPYDQPSEQMRGPCMMYRRINFVHLPDGLINDDQFLQYIYWPKTKEVYDAIVYFNSVSSITDYYKRFVRIIAGANQLNKEFSESRINKCYKDLHKKLDYYKIFQLPLNQGAPFLLYRLVRIFVNLIVKIRLKISQKCEWFRVKQN